MKAVIVDIRRKTAAALDENGQVVRIHNANYEIGQTIELYEAKPARAPSKTRRFSTGVAAALLVAMIGTGTAYALPYGTVTLDGSSSIEYTINCFDYVLDVKAADAEGEAMLSELDTSQLRHHRIDRAVTATVEQLDQSGYFEQEDAEVRVAAETRNENHSEQLQQELTQIAERDSRPPESLPGTDQPGQLTKDNPTAEHMEFSPPAKGE